LLFLLIRKGYHVTVNWMLKTYPGQIDVNRGTDWHGNTPIHYVLNFFPDSTCAYMLREGANMHTRSNRRDDQPPATAAIPHYKINSQSITPMEILRVPRGHPRYPKLLNVEYREGLFWSEIKSIYRVLHVAAAGIWRWHIFNAHMSQADLSLKPGTSQKPLLRWCNLPNEVLRIIIGHVFPSFSPRALDEKLEFYVESYKRHNRPMIEPS